MRDKNTMLNAQTFTTMLSVENEKHHIYRTTTARREERESSRKEKKNQTKLQQKT